MERMTDLSNIYNQYFSLKNLGPNIQNKLALISLLSYLVKQFQAKKPGVTYYQVIKKLNPDLPEDFCVGLAIVAEDFAYGCKDFPTFGVEDKNLVSTLKDILNNYLPF